MLQKVLLNFSKKADSFLASFAAGVIAAMTGNAYFPNPTPDLKDISNALADYVDALSASVKGSSAQVAIKNQKKEALDGLLRSLATYINFTAAGDRAKLLTTGYQVSPPTPTSRLLGPIELFEAKQGKNSGDMELTVKAKFAVSAMYQYTANPLTENSTWESALCREMTCVISNLTPGDKMWFRAQVTGSRGQFRVSEPLMRIAV